MVYPERRVGFSKGLHSQDPVQEGSVVPRKPEGRILLVDDLALVRRTVPARLGALGREVHAVSSVPEARDWLGKHAPALILLDVVLPGTDGFTFCRELKEDPRYQHISVIMFTDVGGNIFDRSLEAGADDYIPKRSNDAYLRIRIHLHLQLADLRAKRGEATAGGPSTILLATHSTLLQAQLPSQLAGDGHLVRLADRLDDIFPMLTGEERLLILDMAVDPEGIHGFLSRLRMDPETAAVPVLLLCEKDDTEHLAGLEFMLDDVLMKPLTAQVNRHRLKLLLEMGRLIHGA
jgi:two-component system, cell cycle response regulator